MTGIRGVLRGGLMLGAMLGLSMLGPSRALASMALVRPVARNARFLEPSASIRRVLRLEAERLALMPAVAAWKWRHHIGVYAPARERAILAAAQRLGAPLGLAGVALQRLFQLQMRLARTRERTLERRWRTRGFTFHGHRQNLKTELRPRLDRLTHALVAALYLAAPTLSGARFASRFADLAARTLTGAGWSAASRRELLARLAAVHLAPAPALARIEASHVLRIGTTGDYAPFSADVNGQLHGVDIELARDLARRLGARPVFVRTSWPTLLADLRHNDFDVALGGISATPARAAVVGESIGYLSSGKTLIARCRDARRFASLAQVDRRGVRVIVNPGGTNERYVRAHVHRATILVDPNNENAFEQIIAGHADVMITDDVEVAWQVHLHPQLCRTFSGTLTQDEKVALMARDPALEARVNAWLRSELASGVPAAILHSTLSR